MKPLHVGRNWLRSAGRTALLAVLALASQAVAADAPGQVTPAASRYAAKQVRLPQETPVASRQRPLPAASAARQPASQVRRTAHQQPLVPARGAQARAMQPNHLRTATRLREQSVMVQEGEVMMEGETMLPEALPAPPPGDGAMMHSDEVVEDGGYFPGDAPLVDGPCYNGMCNPPCSGGPCGNGCCMLPFPRLSWDNVELFAGADSFSGPLNRGQGGSFGFHEGVNWGNNLLCTDFVSAQLGFQAIQSTFNGNNITDQDRGQFFVTGGFFRRVDWGLQGGLVVDFMHDQWYYNPIDLAQVRGELSWVFPCNHEIGFWFTQGINNAVSNSVLQTGPATITTIGEGWHATDLYAFFYRRQFANCGATGRVFGGFTNNSDGLVGADFQVPLCETLALQSNFTYLIPNEGGGLNGNVEEAWNVSIGLVWYPGCRTATSRDYNRPLFNVANNGTFMVDRD